MNTESSVTQEIPARQCDATTEASPDHRGHPEPNRRTVTHYGDREKVEEETAALSSVEVGEDAKGVVHVKTVKAYHSDVDEASRRAVATYFETRRLIDGHTEVRHTVNDSDAEARL